MTSFRSVEDGESTRSQTLTLTTARVECFVDAPESTARFALVAFCGAETEVVPLSSGQPVVVGRRSPSEMLLESAAVSRQHARFSVTADGVLVEDLDSHNGTLVNGLKVKEQRLEPGDQVEIGPARFVLAATVAGKPASSSASDLVIVNPAMKALYQLVEKVASRNVPALILGETGTGKEHLARTLHVAGSRREHPFVAVNCASIPQGLTESILFGFERGAFTGAGSSSRGLFEQADRGVLFLDEIGELPLVMQAALLRVLESKHVRRVGGAKEIPVDVRLVTATHCDIERMVEQGSFRRDLYYRINTVVLQVPPLRERRDEIAPLARKFLDQARQEWGCGPNAIDDDAMAVLVAHPWPGNIRELRHVIQRAVLVSRCDRIGCADLPALPAPRPAFSTQEASLPIELREEVDRYEAELIERALRETAGNCGAAAKLLRIPLRTLFRKLKHHRSSDEAHDGES